MVESARMSRGSRRPKMMGLLLVPLLAFLCVSHTLAADVAASDDPSDFSTPYRYIMNGSELSQFAIGSITLVPLSNVLWNISPQEFISNILSGKLQNVNTSTAADLPPYAIPYISCDDPDVMEVITDSFNSTDRGNVLAAVLYSQLHSHCNISSPLAAAGWLNLLTVGDKNDAQHIAALGLDGSSERIVQIIPDSDSLPPDTHLPSPHKGSPIPMIVLYTLASIITVLLLLIIVGGAIKARRHPERYGPRAILRPRQSRAKGIAMAMLETLPIVKFGDPDPDLNPKAEKPNPDESDVEMTSATQRSVSEDQASNAAQQPIQPDPHRASHTPDIAQPPVQQDTLHEGTTSDMTNKPPNPSASAAEASDGNSTNNEDSSLGCSICAEDFNLGEDLRVLPCKHRFHAPCVDPWLLNVSGTCPLCRIDLRPPQEPVDEEEAIVAAFPILAISPSRPTSTIGNIMRGTRGVDRQSIVEASREERIRFLRRWGDERRSGLSGAGARDGNANINTRGRSLRLSRGRRDGLGARTSQQDRPAQRRDVRAMSAPGLAERPSTWYAGAAETGRATDEGVPELPPIPPDIRTLNERVSMWYGNISVRPSAPNQERRASVTIILDRGPDTQRP